MKTKFIAIFAGLTMLASMSAVSAAEAIQGEVAGNCPDGIRFVLNAASTETNKIVDIFYFGNELNDLSSYSFKVYVPAGISPVYTQTFDGTLTDSSEAGLLNVLEADIQTTAWGSDKKVGSFTLATPEGHGELRVELKELDLYASDFDPDSYAGNVYYDGTGEFDNGDASWLIIPAAAVEPPVDPEPPVVQPETIAATSAGKFTQWADAATQAFRANLTAAQSQSAKTVTWNVTDGTNTKSAAANLGTVTGIDMVIGLIVTNAVDGLSATVVVE